MEDRKIVELFWSRDPRAIEASQEKYAQSCQSLAEHLLGSFEDGQECVNDALHRAWDTIPPQRPDSLRAYLKKIVRNLAIDRWRSQTAQRRGGELSALALEMEDCLPAAPSAETTAKGREITAFVDRWLDSLPREDRVLFVRRYWYGDALDELADRFGGSPNRLAQKLYRLRGGLRRALEKEGVIIMSMRSERLLVQLGEIRAESIEEADEPVPGRAKKRPTWKRWAALAAGLAIVLFTAGVFSGVIPILPIGGNAGGEGANPADSGPSTFMSYAGPVFPLTLRTENDSITAQRDITLDFLPWTPEWLSNEDEANSRENLTEEERQEVLGNYNDWYPDGGRWLSSTDILVADAYTLTNTSDTDQTLTVLYPFAGVLYGLNKYSPVLTADGTELETVLHVGGYAGGYEGVWRGTIGGGDDGSVNMKYPDSWEDYRDALADGSYLANALGGYPDLSGVLATVYEFTDPWGEEQDEKAGRPNPTIRVDFALDYEKTVVLSYGFNGSAFDPENGWMSRLFSIPQPRYGYSDEIETYYLIVIGDDVENMTTQGYVTGGWDTEDTIEAGVTVRRYETDLESVLRQTAGEMYRSWEGQSEFTADFEMYFGLLKGWLVTDGALSGDPAERYGTGALEDNDVRNADRVFYLEAEVTVPAGGSVRLTAEMTKEGSYDFYCTHTKNQGVYGYDLVTELGSNLTCTGQRAAIEDRGLIEIVRQNFGFDLEYGVKTVNLNPAGKHYYLEVRAKK